MEIYNDNSICNVILEYLTKVIDEIFTYMQYLLLTGRMFFGKPSVLKYNLFYK